MKENLGVNSFSSFSKWRQRLWPIHSFELKKLVPLISMKFFISLVYAVLACMKDTMVVTAEGSGAEVIPVLKGWIVLPAAVIITLLYTRLTNIFKRSTLFYGTITVFLLIIGLYGFVLYPNAAELSPTSSADWLLGLFGKNYSHWVSVYRNWIPTLFFVTAELWGGLVIFLLFWGFANQISSVGEAKRTYTLFIAAGDLASMVAGPLVLYYAKKLSSLDFAFTIKYLTGYIILFCFIIMLLHSWLQKYVLKDQLLVQSSFVKNSNEKTKLSFLAGLKHIVTSKYLLSVAIMVIGYGLCINLIEVTWKANLKLQYPNPADYQAVMGTVTYLVGTIALVTVLLFGGGIIRFFGWHFSAQITPFTVGLTGLLFFVLILLKDQMGFLSNWIGITPLMLIVIVGGIQNVLSKVVKYSFFDPTKEMAFIPLDQESKVKGKAAIDVVGARLGKSGSAWIQVGLIDLLGTGSVLSISTFLTPIVAITVICWIYAVRYVGQEFTAQTAKVQEQ